MNLRIPNLLKFIKNKVSLRVNKKEVQFEPQIIKEDKLSHSTNKSFRNISRNRKVIYKPLSKMYFGTFAPIKRIRRKKKHIKNI